MNFWRNALFPITDDESDQHVESQSEGSGGPRGFNPTFFAAETQVLALALDNPVSVSL